MKKSIFKGLILFMLLTHNVIAFSQSNEPQIKDSLIVDIRMGLMGRLQTGNLSQISLLPNASISIKRSSYFINVNTVYHFIRVNDFDVKNDFWFNGLLQYRPKKRIFPSFHSTIGFAASYLIDYSSLTGAGLGINILNPKNHSFFQAHIFGGYLHFKYQEQSQLASIGLGSLIRANIPIGKKVNFQWLLSTYQSTKNFNFWGGGNLFQFNFIVSKQLVLNLVHQSYYNNETASTIKNTNTEMLYGFQYNFSNN